MRGRLIAFHDGRRIERPYEDYHDAIEVARKLRKRGVKAAIVTPKVLSRFRFPPPEDNLYLRGVGMLWCPYCRAWRWFKVPKFKMGAPPDLYDEQFFLNACFRQGIKVCAWCHISEVDWYVRRANNMWDISTYRRRRRRRVRS